MVLDMPAGKGIDETMALGGIHYLVPISKNIYGGVNMHAALFGDQGGLFALGVELGYSQKILTNLYADANFNFGGGGGFRNLINKGAFLNSNIGLAYHFPKVNLGIQLSHFNFYTGSIKSNALSFYVELPTNLVVSKYSNRNKLIAPNQQNLPLSSIRKSAFALKLDQYLPFGNSRKDLANNNELITNTLSLIGFEYQRYLTYNSYLFIHTDAMYKGLVAGFMDVFGGLGYEPIQTKHLSVFTKLGIGAAGGRIRAEGGATIYPSIGFDYHITPKTSVFTHVGYTRALDGYFEALTIGGGIKFDTFSSGSVNNFSNKKIHHLKTSGVRFSIQHQTYFNVNRIVREPLDLHLLAVQVNMDINEYLYLTGQAAFAYESTYKGTDKSSELGAGGYADGMVGFGCYSPIFAKDKIQLFAELLGGAGGGAGIDTGEGILMKAKIGGYYHMNDDLAIIASIGKVATPNLDINSNNINIGISVNFSTLQSILNK